jgi:hypothetical protein
MPLTERQLHDIIARRIRQMLKTSAERTEEVVQEIVGDIDFFSDIADGRAGVRELHPAERPSAPPPPDNIFSPVPRGEVKSPEPRLVVMPGEPEFEQAKQNIAPEKSNFPRRIVSSGVAHKPVEKKWWLPETLIKALEDSLPETIEFTPQGTDIKVPAVRNIVNQAGLDTVRVQYANPAANMDLGSIGTADQQGTPKLPLVASIVFSCYQKEIDVEDTMQKIVSSLTALYRPRPKSMIPAMGMEVPLRLEDAAATDSERFEVKPGWQTIADPKSAILQRRAQEMRESAPDAVRKMLLPR